ncbi:MAG: bifunctional demethylmenaquinone methyltransferase/2-methoxy-6-polyprenyl-1,4-benzoquinol methylase UbiE [Halioglobus sp.]|nr:bifunctional demethylmenaquinone methyltransferase/2-methoxy-6-polyprenyl-1,4-benzoquinol methylase UbiE [Halioglobus sp.]
MAPGPAGTRTSRSSSSSPDHETTGHQTSLTAGPHRATIRRSIRRGCKPMGDKDRTHFGFKEVETDAKAGMVADVFHSVAARYDLMNDLMSAGIHRVWKRFTIELSGVRTGHSVLDIAGGTGDLAARFADIVGPTGRVVLADINDSMLKVGRDKLLDHGRIDNLEFVQADAQNLPFPDASFDCVTIAFGLRNVTDKDAALRSMLRVLKPGGCLLVLEFSKPANPLLSRAYDAYSFRVLPLMGRLVANDADSYQYLAESIRMHPDQETLKDMMEDAGFTRCEYHNMTGGVVALHKGVKA